MKEKKQVTISDIAKATGYSKTAVSFAFNSPSRISAEACEKIRKTAEEMGYLPDPMARSLSLGKYLSLGFLLPQDTEAALSNPYILEVIRGLGKVCQEHNYSLTVIPPVNHSIYEAVKGAMVDGLVTMGYILDDNVQDAVKLRALPLVMIDGAESRTALSINIDDQGAARTQLEKVLEAGHRKIALVSLYAPAYQSGPSERGLVEKRLDGYEEALKGYEDVTVYRFVSETRREAGMELAKTIAALDERPTAVAAMADIVAIGIIQGLKSLGISVPDEVSVVGFDNITEGEYVSPSLTTIAQPAYEKGAAAAEAAFKLIKREEVDRSACSVDYKFIERESLKRLI